jgi:hypothetical protein
MTGAITVANGGSLAFANDTLVYSSGRINYASGSSGSLSSQTTSTYIPKGAVTFPSTTTIAIDFSKVWGGLLPDGWTLCQSACNGTTKTIHAEDLTTTPKVPATYVYIECEREEEIEERDEKIEERDEKIEERDEKIEELEGVIEGRDKEIEGLEEENSDLREENDDLKNRIRELSAMIEELREDAE